MLLYFIILHHMKLYIKIKDKETKQIYETNSDYYVFSILLTKNGDISSLVVFNKDTGTFRTRSIKEFIILNQYSCN